VTNLSFGDTSCHDARYATADAVLGESASVSSLPDQRHRREPAHAGRAAIANAVGTPIGIRIRDLPIRQKIYRAIKDTTPS